MYLRMAGANLMSLRRNTKKTARKELQLLAFSRKRIARTVRNDKSSRFGKFMELQFDCKDSIVAAKVETYLLEKVRLIQQADEERNYHVFSEVLAGLSGLERPKLLLRQRRQLTSK